MIRFSSLLVALAACVFSLAVLQADIPRPEYPVGRGDKCVEPTEVMRRDHFRFLRHQRDDTVHRGIRTSKHSLIGCVECHAVRDSDGSYFPLDDKGQFCSSCHEYSAVKIDCFACHAAVPDL